MCHYPLFDMIHVRKNKRPRSGHLFFLTCISEKIGSAKRDFLRSRKDFRADKREKIGSTKRDFLRSRKDFRAKEGEGMDWFNSIGSKIQAAFITKNRWQLYLKGLGVTMEVAVLAAILGIVIGTIIAFMKLSTKKNGKPTVLTHIANIYIDVIRGTPSMLQLLIMWFVVLKNSHNGIMVAAITFGINSGAYVAEIVRAGILAVDKGQTEAGRSLGLSQFQTMRYIVIPQAFKNVLPPLGNEFIVLIKETAIVGYVGLSDLTRVANQLTSTTYDAFAPLVGAAVVYFIIIKILTVLLERLERRLRKSDHR